MKLYIFIICITIISFVAVVIVIYNSINDIACFLIIYEGRKHGHFTGDGHGK